MSRLLLFPLLAVASDDEVRGIVKKLRRKLGYYDLPEIDAPDPKPLPDFWIKVFEAMARFMEWFLLIGWKFVLPAVLLLLAVLIVLSVRKVKRKKIYNLSEESSRPDKKFPTVKVMDKTADQWYSDALNAQRREDFSTAAVSLYRASLARSLETLRISREMSNRDIAGKLANEKQSCFTELYRHSDSVVFGSGRIGPDQFISLHDSYRRAFG